MRAAAALALCLLTGPARAEPTARFPDAPGPPAPSPSATPAPSPSATPTSPTTRPRIPSGASALVERGERFVAQGRLTEALSAYTEAIRLEGSNGSAVLALARLRLRIRDVQEAERLLSAATRFSDSAAAAYAERAHLRESQGRTGEAMEDLERAAALAPDEHAVAVALAKLHVQRRAWIAALSVQRRLLAETRDAIVAREARLTLLALGVLAGSLDPVRAGGESGRSFTRRALSRILP